MKFRIAYPKVEDYDIVVTGTGGLFDDFMSPKGKKIKILFLDDSAGDCRPVFEELPDDHPAQEAAHALIHALIYGSEKVRLPEVDFRCFDGELKLLAEGEDPGEGMLVAEVEVGDDEDHVTFLD